MKLLRTLSAVVLLALVTIGFTIGTAQAALNVSKRLTTGLSLELSPNRVQTGDSVVISGVLTAAGKGLAGQKVAVQHAGDTKTWVEILVVSTDSRGTFLANWSPTTQGTFRVRAVFAAKAGYSGSTSSVIQLQVDDPASPTALQFRKGVVIEADVLMGALPSPSLSQLRESGFTIVGTDVLSSFGASEINVVTGWVSQAHSMGMEAFAMIQAEPTLAAELVRRAVSIGFDAVVLDELAANYNVTKAQLLSVIDAGLAMKADLAIIVTEYWYGDIKAAYSWTSNYPTVRVATDNYGDKSIIDLGIQQAQQYGKQPLVWLLSANYLNTDCYANLDTWIAYVKQRNLETLFYSVDPSGSWQAQWSKVQAF